MNTGGSVLNRLTDLLKKHESYVVQGNIDKDKIAEDARKYDAALLNLLQSDANVREHFFVDTNGGLIFKREVFLQFISSKDFLPDSYTRYKNRIGLGHEDGSLLSSNHDVVLNWPYKDCILEGGQDKEDQKRREVFFNEILAPDQLTRLLDSKVFHNWRKYDVDGWSTPENLSPFDNLVIRGNNLLALWSLRKRYAGRVKLIYIDPPYNTGNDSFQYNDSFNHSSWLVFMRNRLTIANELLSPDGFIIVQCDDNEQPYLSVLMDEIFGRENGVNTVVVKMSETSGVKMAHVTRRLPKLKEFLLVYSKSANPKINPVRIKKSDSDSLDEYLKYYNKIIRNFEDEPEDWIISPISEYMTEMGLEMNDESIREFKLQNSHRVVYRTNNRSLSKIQLPTKIGRVNSTTGIEYIWWEGKQMLFLSQYTEEYLGDLWTDISTINLNKEGNVTLANGKKPEKLIHRIIELTTRKGDIVLDYHLGSGTTAAVAHKIGRQYIGIEQLDYESNDAVQRLKGVVRGEQSGVSKLTSWGGGGSFVYAELMNNAADFKHRVYEAKTSDDYQRLFEEAMQSSFLSYRVDPSKLNPNDFSQLSGHDQRRLLLELIDNNTLYVNYEDINDPIHKVSDVDKKLNKEFYECSLEDVAEED